MSEPKYKFPAVPLAFVDQTSDVKDGAVVHVLSRADNKLVGVIKKHKNFDRYLFQPQARKILDENCCKQIQEILKHLNK